MKGQEVWGRVSQYCDYRISKVDDAVTYNMSLTKPLNRPEIRNSIYCEINELGYSSVARSKFKPSNYRIIKLKTVVLRMRLLRFPIFVYRLIKR